MFLNQIKLTLSILIIKLFGREKIKKNLRNRKLYRLNEYNAVRIHSWAIDQILSPYVYKIEKKLRGKYPNFKKFDYEDSQLFENGQPWIGLHPEVLQTPYNHILKLFEYLENHFQIDSIVDIGCAYARAAFVKSAVFPKAKFKGYEIVQERAMEAQRLIELYDLDFCEIKNENVFNCEIADADLYLIYDFSFTSDLHEMLKKLSRKNEQKILLAVTGHQTAKIVESHFLNFYAIECPVEKSAWFLYSNFQPVI